MGAGCYHLILNFSWKQKLLLQFWLHKEKHQSLQRGWINLLIVSKFYFFRRNILWGILFRPKSLERRWCWLFFIISRLQKYCTATFIWKIIWNIFMWIFNAFFGNFNYRCKIIIKGVGNIIRIGYSITFFRESPVGTLDVTVSWEKKDFIPLPCVLNIILISFKIFIISRFTFFMRVDSK